MQLSSLKDAKGILLAALVIFGCAAVARAENGIGTTTTLFFERGGPMNMTVITPSVAARVDLADPVSLDVAWEADIVTGASVAVVDAPSGDVDAISSATQLTDTRHTFGGGLELRGESTTFSAGYAYGFESDYRSHSFQLAAHADLFERNTGLDLSYARGFDSVCNLSQPRAQEAVDRQRLPSSDGCFEADDRESIGLDTQTFQAGWTQNWTPIFVTQLTVTGQLLNGYQGNPYRGVWLGRTAAQEFHPENRARYAGGLSGRLYIEPVRGILMASGRAYRDTWDIQSVTAEVSYEQLLGEAFRLRARGRYYNQTSAAFFSNDYTRMPRGQYFTGDRELSAMSSFTVGGRAAFSVPADEEGLVLGFLDTLELVGKADLIFNSFPEFKYGAVDVPNTEALSITLSLQAGF